MPLLTRDTVSRVMAKFLYATEPAALKEIASGSDENITNLERVVASILLKAIETGDFTRLNALLDRSIGKVKEHVELEGELTSNVVTLNPAEKVALLQKTLEIAKQREELDPE